MTKTRLLIGTAMMLVSATPAMAQLRPTDSSNSVLVDLSQIDALTPQRLGGNTGLLPPPPSAPTSRLLGISGASRAAPVSAPASAPVSHLTRPAAPSKPSARSKAPKATASAAPAPKASVPKAPAKAVATPVQEAAQAARTENAQRTPAPSLSAPTPLPGMTLVGPGGPSPSAAAKSEQQTAAVAPQARVEPPVAPAPTPPAVELPKAPEPPAPAVASAPPAAPPAPPAPAAAAPARPVPQQQAAVQPRTPAAPESSEVRFAAGDANLGDDGKTRLDRLADAMKANAQSRLQLLAYAVEDGSPSKSRRLSLSRALAVRSYLINKGVQSARIDVRALGDSVPSGDPNRVDLKILDR